MPTPRSPARLSSPKVRRLRADRARVYRLRGSHHPRRPRVSPGARLDRRHGTRQFRVDFNVDLFNAFNSDAILVQNNTFGAAWQRPLTVIQPRFVKVAARWDF